MTRLMDAELPEGSDLRPSSGTSRLTRAARHIGNAQSSLGPEMRTASPGLLNAWDEINHAAVLLAAQGARPYATSPQDPLDTLTKLQRSKQEGAALLDALAQILPLAEALDKRQGNWVGDLANTDQGETPGTNYAEAVQELLLRLQSELGAQGSGRE